MGGRRNGLQYENLPEAFTALRSDYAAAKAGRFRRTRTGISLGGSGADYHYRSEADYLKLIEYARDMDRNDAIVGQTINRAVINTIQNGLKLDPDTGDAKLDQDLWDRWNAFATDAEQCDIAGEHDYAAGEFFGLRSTFVEGDMIELGTAEGPLQQVEGHRIRTPQGTRRNVVNGVLLDAVRRRMEYWITKDDIDPLQPVRLVSDIKPYPVRDEDGHRQIFHLYNPKRVSQTRGVSALAPIFDLCGMFEDVNFAKLVQQQIVSCFAIFRQREAGFNYGKGPSFGEDTTEVLPSGGTRVVGGIAPGIELTGYPGEELKGFSPAVPNPEFFPHMELILTLVGINLGMPLILVLMDAKQTNLSSWRGAYELAKMGFRWNQDWLIRRKHAPNYRWKVRQWMAEDAALRRAAARPGIRILNHTWKRPAWPYVQPLDEAKARDLRVKSLQASPRRIAAEDGADFEEIAGETVKDNSYAIRLAKAEARAINAAEQDDSPVSWRDLLFLTGDQKTAEVARAADEKSPSQEGTP